MIIDANPKKVNWLGRLGENEAREMRFPVGDTLAEHPGAAFTLLNRRNGDADAYPVPGTQIRTEGTFVYWTLTSGDLISQGDGECELIATESGAVCKDEIYRTEVGPALDGSGDPPEPWESWQQQVAEDADRAEDSAEDAEAWAVGQRGGEDVGSSDPTYHNNAKYWSDQAEETLSSKADKVSSATSGNFAGLDSNGNLTDSGSKASDFLTEHQDISGKADKVDSAVSGNFAGLDGNGNLTDSGSKASDFLTSHQDISGKADKVASAVSGNFAGLDENGNLTDSGSKASDFLTEHQDISGKLDKTDFYATEMPMGSSDSTKVSAAIGDLKSAIDGKADVIEITDSTSEAVKTIADGADGAPMAVTVGIEPVQSGSGDPSPTNVRPISGWTGCNVARTNNLLDEDLITLESGKYIDITNGSVSSSAGYQYVTDYLPLSSGLYTIKCDKTATQSRGIYAIFYDANKAFIEGITVASNTSSTGNIQGTFTVPVTAKYTRFDVPLHTEGSLILQQGETVTITESKAKEYQVTFPSEAGTVYGGELTVNKDGTGKLTVTDANIASYDGETLPGEWISDRDVYESGTTPTTGAQVVYKLAEEVVYDLTVPQIMSLLGTNNVWADTGNVLNLEYVADTKTYVDQSIPSVPVQDVQVNGTTILNQGVANVPLASSSAPGAVVVTDYTYGLAMRNDGNIRVYNANANQVKAGIEEYRPIVPLRQDSSVFYGLAKASGDSTQASSSNSVGKYTETAQSKISDMLNAPVSVSGSTPSITGKSGIRYVCGTCSTLSITPPASGCIDVVFTSGSTATVLTVPNTVKFPAWFDPTSLDANTTYEINILDGEYGVVCKWT